jgi:hypothetical protein
MSTDTDRKAKATVVNLEGRLTVSPREAAAAVGKGIKQLYEDINSGKLPSGKDGKRRFISVSVLRKYADQIAGVAA